MKDYTLSEEDMRNFIQTHDMVVCDLWGKVEGQFRALKARGIPTAFRHLRHPSRGRGQPDRHAPYRRPLLLQ